MNKKVQPEHENTSLIEQALLEERNFMSAVLDTIGSLVLVLDQQGRILHFNRACEKTTGFMFEEVNGKNIWETGILPVEVHQSVRQVFNNLCSGMFPNEYENHWLTKEGERRLIAWSNSALLDDEGKVKFVIPTGIDITERRMAEKNVWEEKERAQVTLHSIGDAVITTDAAGLVEFLNPVAEQLTGWVTGDALGRPLLEVFPIYNEVTGVAAENPVERCLREGRIIELANHTVLINKDNQSFAIEDSAAPIRNKNGEIIGVVLVFHDVTEKRNLHRQLLHQAFHDPLTDLPNRNFFNNTLNQAINKAKKAEQMIAVMFLDLDRFKMVNDMYGHALGDQLLKKVARRLSRCLGDEVIISRLGGDEFNLMLPQINNDNEAVIIAQNIIEAFQKPWVLGAHEFHITASIGIALYPNHGKDPETLMKHADTAMYLAKEKGKNTYELFNQGLNEKIKERLDLENSLRYALERDEFLVFYQPQVDILTGKITGAEALLRWQHPQRGLVSPADFIFLAEETGIIIPLGEWVLRTACAQNKSWQDAGLEPIRITVNLSACQFQHQNFVDTMAQVIKDTGLNSDLLEVEITESVAMKDADFTIKMLRELREMGVNIAIDDFGTGYSSLNYLKKFPINTLKIDRSFIKDIDNNPEDAAIVNSIIVLAHNLGLKVVAEGVETRKQLDFLKLKKCQELQGFLLSKPVPVRNFEQLLIKGGLYD